MKIKLESSKYDFKIKEDEDSFKARIKDSLDIDIEKFEFNAGLRSIAKLCLNSLWGKFGQRSNMSQTKYVMDVSEFYEILLDDKLGNKNFQFINDDMVQMTTSKTNLLTILLIQTYTSLASLQVMPD